MLVEVFKISSRFAAQVSRDPLGGVTIITKNPSMKNSPFITVLAVLVALQYGGCQNKEAHNASDRPKVLDSLAADGIGVQGRAPLGATSFTLKDSRFPIDVSTDSTFASEDPGKATFFGLLVQRDSRADSIESHELLIIGRFADGQYSVVEDEFESDAEDPVSSRRAAILKFHRSFVPFQFGNPAGRMVVTQLAIASYDCSELVVGQFAKPEPLSLLPPIGGRNGSSNGDRMDSSLSIAFAIETAWFMTHPPREKSLLPTQPSDEKKHLFKSFCLKEFQKTIPSLSDSSVKLSELRPFLLGTDTAYVFTSVAQADHTISSLAVVALIDGNSITTRMLESESNESDSWGSGHELLDVIDIDGDAIPELIFTVGYYESTGCEIYKYIGNRFTKVYGHVLWGC